MHTYLAIDIETLKNDEADLYFGMGLGKVDSRLKDPKKIEDAIAKQKTKCALSWWLGKVCMISTQLLYENPIYSESKISTRMDFYGVDEIRLLKEFGNYLAELETDLMSVNLIAKNGKGFDFPFLVGRYLHHNIGVPNALRAKRVLRDVDEMFGQWGKNSQITTLANYAWGMGIDGKSDPAGYMRIEEWYNSNSWDEMQTYCCRDKDIIVEMIQRYRTYQPIAL